MKLLLKDHSKSSILRELSLVIKNATILPQYVCSYHDWIKKNNDILRDIEKLNFSKPYIVRSSSSKEDNENTSNAGHFESILDVFPDDVPSAINKVFNSYEEDKEQSHVFIQPMIKDVLLSGVMFTTDPSTGSYYYIINYDDTSRSTDSVTSGSNNNFKIFYHFKGQNIKNIENPMKSIILLAKELEELLGQDNLDIEFALSESNELYLFQVRTLHCPKAEYSLEEIIKDTEDIKYISNKFFKEHPYLFGEQSILGVMTDWNPAEIVGIRPKQLSLSLYKELITDRQWAYQRFEYGYRNVKSFPLIYDFKGLPYIDIRVSFNSFIPENLNDSIAKKLSSFYLKELRSNPHYHDKVEFQIVLSCYTFGLENKINRLKESGFLDNEIEEIVDSLKNLTNTIIKDNDNLTYKDYKKIEELQKRQNAIMNSKLSSEDKIYWLIEDCKRYGTLAFAGLARAGFIAVELLKSLVTSSIFSEKDFEQFMNSVESVSSNIYKDFLELPRKSFLEKYGHLRPGTYDINSYRYDEKEYFITSDSVENQYVREEFKISLKTIELLDKKLKENSLDCSASSFLSFCKFAIEAREYGKFIFTKSLSDSLKLLESLATEYNISRDDIAYFDIKDFYTFYTTSENRKEALLNSINRGKSKYNKSLYFSFPPLICSYNDFFSFFITEAQANYITMKSIEADIAVLTDLNQSSFDLSSKIVLIPSADPGYDWVFSHNISGLITKYGGANSHMAIRSAELLIPSIIGCGEVLFQKYSEAKTLFINCANKECKIIK